MTKILRRPPVDVPDRKAVPAAVRAEVWSRASGKCEHPGCTSTRRLEWEHRVPRALGGQSTSENIQLLCEEHHSEKTPGDRNRIAKAKRQEEKSFGEKAPSRLKGPGFKKGVKRKIPSRPMSRKSKGPGA